MNKKLNIEKNMSRKDALYYVYKQETGTISELNEIIGTERVRGFRLSGVIKICMNKWEIGKDWKKIMDSFHPDPNESFFDKIVNIVNFYIRKL